MTGESILCLGSHDWDHLWQRHQELMWRLARDGNRVLYVDALGVRAPGVRDWRRIVGRLGKWTRQLVRGVREPVTNVYVYSPLVLPFLNASWAMGINDRWLRLSIQSVVQRLGLGDLIVWVYLPTPMVVKLATSLRRKLLVYDCADAQVYNPRGTVVGLAEAERRLLEQADWVFAASNGLLERVSAYTDRVSLVPNGVNLERFTICRDAFPEPGDVADLPTPRVGYFGQIDERLDLNLLVHLAQSIPDVSLVLLGVLRTDIGALLRQRNVHWLGSKPHAELPAYLAAMDVLLIPYVLNRYTRAIYPAKLHECLAMGKPVVATDLPELRPFHEVVRIAEDADAFVRHVSEALAEDDPALRARRRQVAEANAWQVRYQAIVERLTACLQAERAP